MMVISLGLLVEYDFQEETNGYSVSVVESGSGYFHRQCFQNMNS